MKVFSSFAQIILALIVATALASPAIADNSKDDRYRDYGADYFEDEGRLLFKLRPLYSNTRAKQTNFREMVLNPGARNPDALVESGFGFDTATTYFFTDYLAAEISFGAIYYKTKKSALTDVLANFSTGGGREVGKKNNVWMFPVMGTVQYHIAPFGAIRPFVGLGYHGTYVFSRAKEFSVDNGSGAVIQAGIDFVAKDDTFITLDVRHMMLESKINYRREFIGGSREISSKVKWNPTLISVGIGFLF